MGGGGGGSPRAPPPLVIYIRNKLCLINACKTNQQLCVEPVVGEKRYKLLSNIKFYTLCLIFEIFLPLHENL